MDLKGYVSSQICPISAKLGQNAPTALFFRKKRLKSQKRVKKCKTSKKKPYESVPVSAEGQVEPTTHAG